MVGTFLLERLIGVSVYAAALLLFWLLLMTKKTARQVGSTLNLYLLVLCILAYVYVPAQSADLYRWQQLTGGWSNLSWPEFFTTHFLTSATPVAYLMMYICSLFRDDGVLPAFCALIFFGNYFAILKDLNRHHGFDARTIATSLLFVMATGCFLEVISGVRCMVSLSILAKCFYSELYNGKQFWKNIPWAVIASLMHAMALVVYGLWIVFSIFRKERGSTPKALSVCGLGIVLAVLLYFGRDYVRSGIARAIGYLTGEGVYYYSWEYLIGSITTLCLAIILRRTGKTMKQDGKGDLFRFNLLLIIMEFVLLFEYNTFHRLVTLSLLVSAPMVCKYIASSHNPVRRQNILVISILILMIACLRGNLCGYKFFIAGG